MQRQKGAVAETILAQLGGRRFAVMTGAGSFASGDDQLTFRLPSKMVKDGGSAMRIILTPNDLYRLELLKIVDFECRIIDRRDDVHCEGLSEVFSDMTGLVTTLEG